MTQKDANGEFLVIPIHFDVYIEHCQNAQDRYEDDLAAATGTFVEHVDVRLNLDGEGNWIGPESQVESTQSSPGEPAARFPILSAEEKAIMAQGFEGLRQRMGSDRGLSYIRERRWPRLSKEE